MTRAAPPSTSIRTAAQAMASARTLVVKLGSALVTGDGAAARLSGIAQDLAALRAEGRRVVLVSSGAVALGRDRVGLKRRGGRLDEKQAAAAVGQPALMRAWEAALSAHGVTPAQVLLTRDDTERRRGWLNARATFEALLNLGALPIVNENDTVATEEIRYGDNDRLAARTAQMVRAEALVLLSDIDGLYDADPRGNPDGQHIPVVEALTPQIMAMASGANAAARVGTGGMATKLQAAEIARAAGCATIISLGTTPNPLRAILDGARATLIQTGASPATAYKQWIAGHLAPKGALIADAGAVAALARGKSLLPSGITAVEGDFRKGDCVRVKDADGRPVAVGLVTYDAAEVERLCGRQSGEIEAILGYDGRPEIIHGDDLVRTGAGT